jgi:hypothetical protein
MDLYWNIFFGPPEAMYQHIDSQVIVRQERIRIERSTIEYIT